MDLAGGLTRILYVVDFGLLLVVRVECMSLFGQFPLFITTGCDVIHTFSFFKESTRFSGFFYLSKALQSFLSFPLMYNMVIYAEFLQ